ncbi:MAG: hypothetical protein CVU47_07630 [Chloroflexi bacterium HGW-Chloroflexi-9]|nr:MAG: hypothetical protein CVU47_07630 [Chloroflexi bacterium HGW-Chloroflexi-9]
MSEHSTSTASSLLITNATLVLPGESIPHGAVAVVDGRIAEFGPAETLRSGGLPVVDAGGAYCLPGLVNLHDDEIEPRTLAAALAVGGEIERDRGVGGLDQHILPRFAIDGPEIVKDVILPLLDQQPVRALAFLGAGYSRFKDDEQLVERLRSIYPEPAGCVALQERCFSGDIAARDALLTHDPRDLAPEELVPYLLCLLHREQERAPFALSTHDDESAEKVSLMHAVGASICEMPVEIEAAERARELGMYVSVGAPNIARGGSTRGRLAASDLVARGLADIIVADYHAPSLLYALFEVVRLGATDLPGVVRLCATNPAEAMGMSDRGQIQAGRRADLALVTIEDGVPVCRATFLEGRMRYSTLPLDARVPVGVA